MTSTWSIPRIDHRGHHRRRCASSLGWDHRRLSEQLADGLLYMPRRLAACSRRSCIPLGLPPIDRSLHAIAHTPWNVPRRPSTVCSTCTARFALRSCACDCTVHSYAGARLVSTAPLMRALFFDVDDDAIQLGTFGTILLATTCSGPRSSSPGGECGVSAARQWIDPWTGTGEVVSRRG